MDANATRWDIIIFGIYGYLIYDVAAHWDEYGDCHSPIQLFLLFTYSAILFHRIIIGLKSRRNNPWLVKKCVNLFFYWIMNPVFVYITVQGIIWQVNNEHYTPSCVPDSRVPWMIWWWIAILVLIDFLLILITGIKVVSWWRVFMFRRRLNRLMSGIDPNSELHHFLLDINQGNATSLLNNQVGLELADIQRLPQQKYSSSLGTMFQLNQESCPICVQDFQEGGDIVSLPSCEHIFHPDCVNNWLLRSPLCPLCRSNVRNNLIAEMTKDRTTELTEASL